ncbi:putative bifunctional diguanylate cyclase/phosphodiesterase [Roseococcus sp. YIM B11640]|uniref:putative bifunctional diguanylate cyclase/phosphodiesterase n=1 Tax=Roseococcus sp. YIM B11640 TaxID=3133973 RepID=UPI003C7E096F
MLHLPRPALTPFLLLLSFVLGAAWLGVQAWAVALPFLVLGGICWRLWRELRWRRGAMMAMPGEAALWSRDLRLIWSNGGEAPGIPFDDWLRPRLAHLPAAEREAEICRRVAAHSKADGAPRPIVEAGGQARLVERRLPGGQVVSFTEPLPEPARSVTALPSTEPMALPAPVWAEAPDPLTGLAGRAAFGGALRRLTADPRGGVILLVDLDHFKSANERHGHAVGDQLLVEAAQRLGEAVRPTDTVSRLGGDEFAILCPGAAPAAGLALAERVRRALRSDVTVQGTPWPMSASIGIAAAPAHGEEADALYRAADLALRAAKAQGRDAAVLFEEELRTRSEQRAGLREALAAALEAGELELHLQTQHDLESRALVGAEALVRWNSRRLGRWISPSEMLPAAGEAGLLPKLDRYVLGRAVALVAEWGDRPDAPPVLGINISVVTLHDPAFAAEVASELQRAGVAPHRIEIEIPEDLAIRDLPGVARTLSALREVGVPLALDDFGGGHSGLPHVVRLPVQRLKLDQSIVAGLPDDPKSYAVLRATMALARGMGIEVIAEGVETQDQAFALRRAGCNIVQGFLLSRPVPAADVARGATGPRLLRESA